MTGLRTFRERIASGLRIWGLKLGGKRSFLSNIWVHYGSIHLSMDCLCFSVYCMGKQSSIHLVRGKINCLAFFLFDRIRIVFILIIFHFVKRELETLLVHRFSSSTMPRRNLFKNCFHYWVLGGVNMAYWIYGPWFSYMYQPPSILISFITLWTVKI